MRSSSSSRRDDAGLRPWYASAIAMMKTNSAFFVRTLGLLLLLLLRRRLFCARVSCVSEDVLCNTKFVAFQHKHRRRDFMAKILTIVFLMKKKKFSFSLFSPFEYFLHKNRRHKNTPPLR